MKQLRFALFLMTVLLLSFSASAQTALPMPAPEASAAAPRALEGPIIAFPNNGLYLVLGARIEWIKVAGATQYRITAKVNKTGQTYTGMASGFESFSCTHIYCSITAGRNNPVFDPVFRSTTNDDKIKVYVTAIAANGEEAKGPTNTNLIFEIAATTLISPADFQTLTVAQNFTWDLSPWGEYFIMIVRDKITGKRVFKQKVYPTQCGGSCSANPFSGGKMVAGGQYTWFVKNVSALGQGAKSAVRTVLLSSGF
jgi:hypothetical protein